jgi:hypothetical protein
MASHTKQMKSVIKRKLTKSGKARKRKLANGTTPRFPVHIEDDPSAAMPQAPGSHPDEK